MLKPIRNDFQSTKNSSGACRCYLLKNWTGIIREKKPCQVKCLLNNCELPCPPSPWNFYIYHTPRWSGTYPACGFYRCHLSGQFSWWYRIILPMPAVSKLKAQRVSQTLRRSSWSDAHLPAFPETGQKAVWICIVRQGLRPQLTGCPLFPELPLLPTWIILPALPAPIYCALPPL